MHWDLDFQEGKGIDSGTKRGGLKGGRSGNMTFSPTLEELLREDPGWRAPLGGEM